MQQPISITSIASISPLGHEAEYIWNQYQDTNHCISLKNYNELPTAQAQLSDTTEQELVALRKENEHYKNVDKSVLLGIYAARKAAKKAGWEQLGNFGINMGSSRGATELFEQYHQEFLAKNTASTLSSPTTTLGNIASWIANDLQTSGPEISHSITCSTALHAVLNGVAWLQSGLTDRFLVGGSEAPLTPFTIAQMKALKIYTRATTDVYPCRALDLSKNQNTMYLGEGAAVACLEKGRKPKAKALITGIGYATEPLKHNISISTNADCFQKSMRMALGEQSPNAVDIIVMHAPGTIKGDQSEYNAIQKVFGKTHPALTTNKWKIGHTFGASGILSMELAVFMLQYQQFIPVPYLTPEFTHQNSLSRKIKNIMVNAVGFGGNAVSILLELP